MDANTILAAARSALEQTAAHNRQLVRSLPDTAVPVPGSEWTIRESAIHLVTLHRLYAEMATGTASPVESLDKKYAAAFSAELIADIPETDPQKVAALMDDAMDRLLEVTAGRPGDQEVVFHAGLRFDLARLVCVALGEHLIHGYDMATAVGRPWPIDPAHALLVLLGYGPVYGLCVNPKTTAGLTAAYGIELRGADPFTVRFIDGEYGVEGSDCGPVDCVIAADPVAFLLVGTGRLSRWAAIALGLLTVSGTKPELGLGFSDLFSYP